MSSFALLVTIAAPRYSLQRKLLSSCKIGYWTGHFSGIRFLWSNIKVPLLETEMKVKRRTSVAALFCAHHRLSPELSTDISILVCRYLAPCAKHTYRRLAGSSNPPDSCSSQDCQTAAEGNFAHDPFIYPEAYSEFREHVQLQKQR